MAGAARGRGRGARERSWMSAVTSSCASEPVAESYPPQCSGIPLDELVVGRRRGIGDLRRRDVGRLCGPGNVRRRGVRGHAAADHARALRSDAVPRPDERQARCRRRRDAARDPGRAARTGSATHTCPRTPRTAGCGSTSCGTTARGRMPRTTTTATTSWSSARRCGRSRAERFPRCWIGFDSPSGLG